MSGKKLSKNIIVYGLSNGLKSLVPFIMIPILTNYISSDEMGLLSLIETTILFLTPFIILNLDAGTSVEYFKSTKPDLAKFISNGLVLSFISFIVISLIFFFLKDFISEVLVIPSTLILLLPIFVLLRLIPTITLILFQAKQQPVSYLFFSVFQTIFDFSLSTLFIIILSHGYLGRLEGTYIAFFIATLIGIYIVHKMGYFNFRISKVQLQRVLTFGIPLIPHAVGATLLAMSDRYFISYFEGNSYVGLYTVSYQIGALMLLFSRSVNQAWSPMLFDLLKNKNYQKAKLFTGFLFGIFLLIGVMIYFSSGLLFHYFVNPSFFEAKLYFGALLLGFVFQSLYMLFANFIFFSKRTKTLAIITFVSTILNLFLNYILIKEQGVIGVAYATAITWFIYFLTTFLVVKMKIYPLILSNT